MLQFCFVPNFTNWHLKTIVLGINDPDFSGKVKNMIDQMECDSEIDNTDDEDYVQTEQS